MKKTLLLILISFISWSCTDAQVKGLLNKIPTQVSEKEVASGLKQALEKGIEKGTQVASAPNGFFGNPLIKIPFPEDVQQVETRLRQAGLNRQVDEFILTLNRAAEDAAKEALPIFKEAILQMSVQDAFGILKGENDAATSYLKRTTSASLEAKFEPVINAALDKVNATKYYEDLVNTYNKIPFVKKVESDLTEYATQKALDGLFTLVAQEELNIRENPGARSTELLRKVFAQQD